VLTLYAVQESAGKAAYKLHGKLMDSLTNIPLQGKEISFIADSSSVQIPTQVTDKAGTFEITIYHLDTNGLYKIRAHLAGDDNIREAYSNTVVLGFQSHESHPNIVSPDQDTTTIGPHKHETLAVPEFGMINSSSTNR
jgi:hypothetical protein